MFTVVLSCTHDGQQSRTRHLVSFHNYLELDYFWSTICDGPSLIKHHRLDLLIKEDIVGIQNKYYQVEFFMFLHYLVRLIPGLLCDPETFNLCSN